MDPKTSSPAIEKFIWTKLNQFAGNLKHMAAVYFIIARQTFPGNGNANGQLASVVDFLNFIIS